MGDDHLTALFFFKLPLLNTSPTTTTKLTTQLKNKILDISPKKTYEWPANTGKSAQVIRH